jgi:hypothetical protein
MAKKKVVLPSDVPKQKPADHNSDEQNENTHTLPNTYQMFARKKDRGFTAMTQEASMRADQTAIDRKGHMPERIKSCIHKIREDE